MHHMGCSFTSKIAMRYQPFNSDPVENKAESPVQLKNNAAIPVYF